MQPPQLPDLPAGPWAHFRQGGWDAASARLLTGVHVTEGSWSCGEADQVEAVSTLSGDLNEGSGGAFSMAVPSLFLCARWSDTTTTATDLVTKVVTTTGDCASGEKKIGKRDSTDAVDGGGAGTSQSAAIRGRAART